MTFRVKIVNVKPKLTVVPEAYGPEESVIQVLEDLTERAKNGDFHGLAVVTVNHKTQEVGTLFQNVRQSMITLGGVFCLANRINTLNNF